jgi:hypothetical protein
VSGDEPQARLTGDERGGIVLAAKSAFTKLKNLYQEIAPTIQRYGSTVPSAGVIARDLSEKIEIAIAQHPCSFTKGEKHCDLVRGGHEWEVKVCKDSGLTINQSKAIHGENYSVVNYRGDSKIAKVWVLWNAQEDFFSPRGANANARSLVLGNAVDHVGQEARPIPIPLQQTPNVTFLRCGGSLHAVRPPP